jgi:hypothetical protein
VGIAVYVLWGGDYRILMALTLIIVLELIACKFLGAKDITNLKYLP